MPKENEAFSSKSSDSNSPTRTWAYDVFLSFRGETRRGFIDHLYRELLRRGFRVFRDDAELQRGEVISHTLLQAIENSQFAVVVLSENYADSSWCLDELQHILASRNESGQRVLPIFYDVNPSDVRHQQGSFAAAFARLEERFDQKRVLNWRVSLRRIAHIAGWDSSNFKKETELIDDVVESLWNESRSKLSPGKGDIFIGMDWRVNGVYSHLGIGLDDVRFIGIWGLGGVGKTTLARAIYDCFRYQFDYHCFLANIREVSEKEGDVHLQRKLFSNLRIRNIDIEDTYEGRNVITHFFHNKKVMLILDDVNSISQLQNLAGNRTWFGAGSRVIITARDAHLLRSHNVDEIYEVKPMDYDESLQMFCVYAFGRDQPIDDFSELCELVIEYARGLPLALRVLGSYLRGRSPSEWEGALRLLRRDSRNDIFKILRISYEGLSDEEREIFLDIACFFNLWGRGEITQILESCGLEAAGMSTLVEKSLLAEIEIGNSKYMEMHNLVQQMGMIIIREKSHFDVKRQSRLWLSQDIDQVLKRNLGADVMKGMVLPVTFAKDKVDWHPEAFLKMSSLQLLIMSCNFDLLRGLKGFPWTLKVLHWYGFPLEALPSEEELDQLVHLKMQNSKLKRLSDDTQLMKNLRFLDLSHSRSLVETPHFDIFPKLERLVLEGCTELVGVHPSLGQLKFLLEVNLKGCVNLKFLPRELEMTSLKVFVLEETGIEEVPESLGSLPSVELLNLRSCRNLKVLPRKLEMKSLKEFILCGCTQLRNLPEFGENMNNLITLDATETGIVELPESLGSLTSLKTLDLRGCRSFVGLPHNTRKLKHLKVLNISACSAFTELQEDLNENDALEILDAHETAITKVPSSIGHLEALETLSFHGCSFRNGLPDSIFNINSLKELDLSYCNIDDGIIPKDLGGLSSLRKLDMSGNMFSNLPAEFISSLWNLRFLYLNSCTRLKLLPQPSPVLDIMDAGDCTSLRTLSTNKLLHLLASIDQSGHHAERILYKLYTDSWVSLPIKTFSATIPGSEIPSCFENQKYLFLNREHESSVIIDIPQCEWLGFVLCTVLEDDMFYSTKADQNIFSWRCYAEKASDGDLVFFQGWGRKHEKEINSPHLWILFISGQKNGSCLSMDFSHLLLKFEVPKIDRLNSIKCGWRVVSKIEFESLISTMEEYEDPEAARGCEAEEERGGYISSASESHKTKVKEYDAKSPEPSSPCIGEEVKLDDSWMQFITHTSEFDSAPLMANTAIQSSTLSSCREHQPSFQENTSCSEAHEEQEQWSLLSLSENSQIMIDKCETMSPAASSPCLEEKNKLEDSQMQFTHSARHRDFSTETLSSSNCCPFESATTQEAIIFSDDSIYGTQVPASNESPLRGRNHDVGDTLVANTVSNANMPGSEQTSAEEIFKELSQVSGLTEAELVQIYIILAGNQREYESFKALPAPSLRKLWISTQIKRYYS